MVLSAKCGHSGYITPCISRVPNAWSGDIKRKSGQEGYITLEVSGVTNAQRGEKKWQWLCSPNVDKLGVSLGPTAGSPMMSAGE